MGRNRCRGTSRDLRTEAKPGPPQEAAADLYVDPNGPVGLNYPEALRLYTLAAATGNAAAQYDLGIMYALGEGVPVNNPEAYFWVLLAARAGKPHIILNTTKEPNRP